MGRDLHWYVIPRHTEHYQFQPDSNDVLSDLKHKLDSQGMCDFINSTGEYTEDWCPKCHMFACGLDEESPLVVAHYHVGHSYSNSIWMSDWSIRNVLIGSYYTPFAELFRRDMMYMEITEKDVRDARFRIEIDREPLRTSDKEAKEEAEMILDKLTPWTTRADEYIVIMRNEY